MPVARTVFIAGLLSAGAAFAEEPTTARPQASDAVPVWRCDAGSTTLVACAGAQPGRRVSVTYSTPGEGPASRSVSGAPPSPRARAEAAARR